MSTVAGDFSTSALPGTAFLRGNSTGLSLIAVCCELAPPPNGSKAIVAERQRICPTRRGRLESKADSLQFIRNVLDIKRAHPACSFFVVARRHLFVRLRFEVAGEVACQRALRVRRYLLRNSNTAR